MKEIKTQVMAIVHGKSEFHLCNNIKSNLKIKHEIISKNKGKHSIQVTSVMHILNNSQFESLNKFKRSFPDVEVAKRKLINFKLFIIMDVDDCNTEQIKRSFIDKTMFKGHWLYDYIVPIYNDPHLEKTMMHLNIPVTKKKDYIKIFPTNHGDSNYEMIKDLANKFEKCRTSNLEQYINYCLEIAKKQVKKI